jgi:hypothetical protein
LRNKKLFALLRLTPIIALLSILFVVPAVQATPLTCNMSTVTGDDDGSFPMTLPFTLQLGNTEYNQIYYSTNGLMSFGRPDGNFWSYPQTPSVTLAGRDWVSWGPGAYTSYGYNESSFCIEWSVRPYPRSSGDLTQIRLVVNRFPNGGWHGEITTLGWIPPDIRRGIVWEQNGTPLPIDAAFDVNGGVPIEVAPAPAPTSFTEPPAIPTQCWDGSTVYAPATCPTEPSYTCWDGSIHHYASECPATPPDIVCWDNSTAPWNGTCSPEPPPIQCWDGTSVAWNGTCSVEPQVVCWDNSVVHYQSECSSTPPNIVCWNGEVVPWNGVCQQVPPPLECWNGTSVNWDAQCPRIPPDTICWDGSVISWNEVCPIEPTPSPTPTPEPTPTVTQEPTPTPEPSMPSPEPTVIPEPTPEPTINPLPSETPTPTPSPSESQSQLPIPVVIPSPNPEQPFSTPSPEVLTPVENPSPDPSPSSIDLPYDNLTTEQAVEQVLSQYSPEEAVPFEVMQEAGLDYSDLPPDQPVMLENGVILTAEVADALQLFENPSEILSTVLTDPGKALKALANVGADMTPTQRKESEKVIIAAIIAGQLMNALGAANMIGRKL